MLEFISAGMKVVLGIFGNILLARFISFFRLWLRELADPLFKQQVEEQYLKVLADWDTLKKDRQGIKRGTNSSDEQQ